jgi:preprotein translocase subunit SecA
MDRALPEDQPIEAKMVSKAIERAQNTVEGKNAEARKNVLKYDEVMNEQRKVIYKRRSDILEGFDLREESVDAIAEVVDRLIETHASEDHPEEWDVDTLESEVHGFWPSVLDADQMAEEPDGGALYQTLASEAMERYGDREELVGEETMRQVERQIMLRLIDQRWREHLYEMDYLREGIHLRAMGQKDPATEWQREGFEMFGQMIDSINSEYVRYIMHVEVKEEDAPAAEAKGPVIEASATKADASATNQPEESPQPAVEASKTPKVNDEFANAGRNQPCPCGSGKKFKHCHGR